tara:strand:- start:207 stop:605 length:399 start_codon:yes stop_codon:yes gene_type:complete
MAGELNGTDVALAFDIGGTPTDVGGLVTNSFTLNNGAIDITNKSSASWRELLDGKGLQSAEISAEIIYSSDAAFAAMKTAALAKTLNTCEIARGASVLTGEFMITSYAETAPDNDKLSVSVSLMSSGPVTGL